MAQIPGIRKILASDFSGAPGWFESVVGLINGFMDTAIGALRGKLTFFENMYCEIRELNFVHDIEQEVYYTKVLSYNGINIMRGPQENTNDVIITGYRARVIRPNILGVKIMFLGAGTTSGLVKIAILGG